MEFVIILSRVRYYLWHWDWIGILKVPFLKFTFLNQQVILSKNKLLYVVVGIWNTMILFPKYKVVFIPVIIQSCGGDDKRETYCYEDPKIHNLYDLTADQKCSHLHLNYYVNNILLSYTDRHLNLKAFISSHGKYCQEVKNIECVLCNIIEQSWDEVCPRRGFMRLKLEGWDSIWNIWMHIIYTQTALPPPTTRIHNNPHK